MHVEGDDVGIVVEDETGTVVNEIVKIAVRDGE